MIQNFNGAINNAPSMPLILYSNPTPLCGSRGPRLIGMWKSAASEVGFFGTRNRAQLWIHRFKPA